MTLEEAIIQYNIQTKIVECDVDFIKDKFVHLSAKQMDNTRWILVTPTEDGILKNMQSWQPIVRVNKPDGACLSENGILLDDGRVLIQLIESFLSVSGYATMDIEFRQEDNSYSTKLIRLDIVSQPYPNSTVLSSDEFNDLRELVVKTEELEKTVSENEDTRIGNEQLRIDAETERIKKENDRIEAERIRIEKETDRIESESLRDQAELDRDSNETLRKASESSRKAEEEKRIINELIREENEERRIEEYGSLKQDIESSLNEMSNNKIEAITSDNVYKVKVTEKDGTEKVSDNLLNTITIGNVEVGDFDEDPTATLTGDFGNQKLNFRLPQGKPFVIRKTYVSIPAMNDDIANIGLYEFVMISSDISDEDNCKLFIKESESSMKFLCDLSGAQGIQGVKGEIGMTPILEIGTVETGAEGSFATATITGTPEHPILNLVIPRGNTGKTENISAAVIPYESTEDTKSIKDVVDSKVGKVVGKGLSTNDFTDEVKELYDEHIIDDSNPHRVTKEQIGLGNVPNVDFSDIKEDLMTKTTSGQTITIKNSVQGIAELTNIPVNLIGYPFAESTKAENGISFTDDGDGSIKLLGTSTNSTYFYLRNYNDGNEGLDEGVYTLSGLIFGGLTKCSIGVFLNGVTPIVSNSTESSITFSISKQFSRKPLVIIISIDANKTFTSKNNIISPMLSIGDSTQQHVPSTYDITSENEDGTLSDIVTITRDIKKASLNTYNGFTKITSPYDITAKYPITENGALLMSSGLIADDDGNETDILPRDADRLAGHLPEYFAKASDIQKLSDPIKTATGTAITVTDSLNGLGIIEVVDTTSIPSDGVVVTISDSSGSNSQTVTLTESNPSAYVNTYDYGTTVVATNQISFTYAVTKSGVKILRSVDVDLFNEKIGTTDISSIGDGTVTGAIAGLSKFKIAYVNRDNFTHGTTTNTDITSGFFAYNGDPNYAEATSDGKFKIKKGGKYLCFVTFVASARGDINRVSAYGLGGRIMFNARNATWQTTSGSGIIELQNDSEIQVVGRDESGSSTISRLTIFIIPLFN